MSSTRMGRPKKPVEVPVIDWVAVSNLDQVIYNWFSDFHWKGLCHEMNNFESLF